MSTPATLAREVAKIVADVLKDELVLDEKHCILGNQNYAIPADKKLFVVVFDEAGPFIGAAATLDTDPGSPFYGKEVQQGEVLHDVRVEMMSLQSNEARVRKEEGALALVSLRAQQAAEQYALQIGRPSAVVDASGAEEPSVMMQRFVFHVKVTALHQKVKDPPTGRDYFDKFNGAAVDGSANTPAVSTEN